VGAVHPQQIRFAKRLNTDAKAIDRGVVFPVAEFIQGNIIWIGLEGDFGAVFQRKILADRFE
jgi:hypothetical protein